ncbi:MAG: Trp biosynthesis-associated membrane protein [Galactobacter sp.]
MSTPSEPATGSDEAAAAEQRRPKPGLLGKRNVVVAGLLSAGVVLLAVTRTWVTVAAPSTGVSLDAIAVSGADAAAGVLALAVVALVCSLAATITGPVARWIIGGIQALVGAGVIGFTIPVLADPASASAAQTAASFGLERVGDDAYELSLWPWAAMAGGLLICVMSVVMLVAGHGWKQAKRFERHSSGHAVVTTETMDDVDRWDAFTDGDDPTEGDVRGARFH